jgi:four helix bundle protein
MSSGLRDLKIWQDSVSLAGDVVKTMRQTMRRETRSVSDAVMATALSVGAHVADGYARHGPTEQRESYMLAKRALLRLETELAVARNADLVPPGVLTDFAARSAHVGRMLTGYLVYLDRQIAERQPDHRGPSDEGRVSLGSARVPS